MIALGNGSYSNLNTSFNHTLGKTDCLDYLHCKSISEYQLPPDALWEHIVLARCPPAKRRAALIPQSRKSIMMIEYVYRTHL